VWRYLALSTVIVVGTVVVVAGWMNRDLIRIKIASVYARSAKEGPSSAPGAGGGAPLRGDAPWALSALPDCLTQIAESTGSLSYVRARMPSGAVRVAPPATLVYGSCAISIVGDEAYVRRGKDRLRIPPHVRFYRAAGLLVLIRETPGKVALRVYQPVNH
jgi:hypothetical protein